LFSKKFNISGKPDYIIKKDKTYIPIEIKTGNHKFPKNNHISQLAVYCHLIEEKYSTFVPYGILIYKDTGQQFRIPYNPKTRFDLEKSIIQMRNILHSKKIFRQQNDYHRCYYCSMRKFCDQKIV
jgi:CRISPR-associated exonuclease Cas4